MKNLEICVNSIESALAAQQGGASRVEVCDNMHEGGTTPSLGTLKQCKALLNIPVFPIIRPRGGDFCYSDREFEVMIADIMMAKILECEGVVLGVLHKDRTVDKERTRILTDLARPMQVTFHRAIDCSADFSEALEDIISLGIDRVLTSGGANKAPDGVNVIRSMVKQAAGRISIMAGSGITSQTIGVFQGEFAPDEFHSTAKVTKQAGDTGFAGIPFEYNQTSAELVRAMRDIIGDTFELYI